MKVLNLTPISIHLDGELFEEQKGKGFNTPLLYKLADKTGGVFSQHLDTFMQQATKIETKEDRTWIFILGSLVFYLASVLLRESR